MNIFENIIKSDNIIPSETSYNTIYYTFDNIKYKIQDIIKLAKLIPINSYSLSVLLPILKTIKIPELNNIFNVSDYLNHILNFDLNYLLLLEINESKYDYIYGYEYIIKSLNLKHKNFAVKTIKPDILQILYLKNKKSKLS